VHAFFRGRNGRPQRKLGGLTPAQAYTNAAPTQEQFQQAKRWILELRRRERLARQSRERHADPVRLQLLREQLAILGMDDPQGQASLSLSGYSNGAICHGLATFHAKAQMGTLPKDADPYRYLGGIIRNMDARELLERTASHLLALRMRVGDLHLVPLKTRAEAIRQSSHGADSVACQLVDAALDATSVLEFRFWSSEARDAVAAMPPSQAHPLCHHLVRVVAACFHTDRRWRERLIASLVEAAVPLAP
jgi:hypothetical protein